MSMVPMTSGCSEARPAARESPRRADRSAKSSPLEPHEVEQVDTLSRWSTDELCHEVVNLRRAVASNRRIGAAVGVVMHERGLDYDAAFTLLRKTSQDTNVPLAQVAATVLHLGRLWT